MIICFVCGFLWGQLIISPLGDKFGRKIMISSAWFISLLLNLKIIFGGTSSSLFISLFFEGVVISIFLWNSLVYIT